MLVLARNPALNTTGSASFRVYEYPSWKVAEYSVPLVVSDWLSLPAGGENHDHILSAGFRNDSVLAFSLDLRSGELLRTLLATTDGSGFPEMRCVAAGDYDLDGVVELFVMVGNGPGRSVGNLYCVDADSMVIEWSAALPGLSHAHDVHLCSDSTTPRVLLVTADRTLSESTGGRVQNESHLVAVDNRGSLLVDLNLGTFVRSARLLQIDNDSTFLLVHARVDSPDGYVLERIGPDGQALGSVTGVGEYRDIWTDGSGITVGLNDSRIRRYDSTLSLVEEGAVQLPDTHLGYLHVRGQDGPVHVFGDGLYDGDLSPLLYFPFRALRVESLQHDADGRTTVIAVSANNRYAVARLVPRPLTQSLLQFWDHNRILFATVLLLLLLLGVVVYIQRLRTFRRLRRTERLLNAVFEGGQDGFFRSKLDGTILWFSNAAARAVGYDSGKDIAGHNIKELYVYPEERQRLMAVMREHGRAHGFETTIRRRDGQEILISVNAEFTRDDKGNPIGLEGVVRDVTESRRNEARLRESEAQFRQVLEHSLTILYRFNLQTRTYDYISDSVTGWLGYTPDEIIAMGLKGVHKLIHPEDLDRLRNHRDHVVAVDNESRLSYTTEYRMSNRRGEYRWLSDSHAAIRDEDGTALYVIGSVTDVTDQKEAQEALRTSEERYRTLQANIPIGVFRGDVHGRIVYANPAMVTMYGYDFEKEFLNEASDRLWVDPDERSELQRLLALHGQVRGYEHRIRRKDGTIIWVQTNIRVVVDADGKPLYYDGTDEDVTERRRARDALRASEEKYRLLVENVPAAIALVQPDGRFLFVNELGARARGFEPRELIGKTMWDVFPQEIADSQVQSVRRVIETGEGLQTERHYRDAGGWKWYSNNLQPFVDDSGKTVAVLIIAHDITERRLAEEALRESEEFNRAVIEHSPLGVSVRSRNGKLLSFNRAWRDIWNVLDEDLDDYVNRERESLQFDHRDNYLGDWLPRVKQVYEQGGYLHVPEIDLTTSRKGVSKWLAQHFYAIRDATGAVDRVVILTEDISERKGVEQALESSRERYRALVEDMPAMVCRFRDDGTLTFVNQAFCRYFERDSSELLGRSFFDLVPAKDHAGTKEYFETLTIDDPISSHEQRVFRGDGEERWQEWTNRLLSGGADAGREYQSVGYDITGRKVAELALVESEEKFRTLAEQTLMGIFIHQDGVGRYCNRAAAEITGYSVEEMMAWGPQGPAGLIHPDDRPFVLDQASRKLRGDTEGILSHYDYRIISADGRIKWVDQYSRTILYAGRNAIFVTLIDITEKKLAERSLLESENRYRSLVESAGESIFSLDYSGRFLFMNSTCAEQLGGSPEELTGKTMAELFSKESARIQEEQVRRVFTTGEAEIYEGITEMVSGTMHYRTSLQPLRDHAGKVTSVLGIARDLTQFVRTRQELDREREFTTSLMKTAASLILGLDSQSRIVEFNRECEEITGYRKEEVLGIRMKDLLSPEGTDSPVLEALVEWIRENPHRPFEAPLKTRSGDVRTILWSVSGQLGERDDDLVVIAVGQDITDRKTAEERIRAADQEKYQQARDIAGGFSHEIRNALFPARSWLSRLARNARNQSLDPKTVEDHVQRIDLAVDRAVEMTNLISRYTRLESAPDPQPVVLADVLAEVLKANQTRITEEQVTLRVDGNRQVVVRSHDEHLSIVFNNLLLNSLDALASAECDRTISIRWRETDGFLELAFRDNGSGIDPGDMGRVFDTFFSTKPNSGTGIGLAMTRKIIEMYGGTITVSSTPGRDTCFWLRLILWDNAADDPNNKGVTGTS
ncbi:MAG: PAS domain S-box protein [candidate division Zixibacteria bacterium]|nr:PAS domain S-box protein [candidate division Zixibacteria bacterium]